MKHSYLTAALAATAGSSTALVSQSFVNKVGKQRTPSSQLFYTNDNGDFNEKGEPPIEHKEMLKKMDSITSPVENNDISNKPEEEKSEQSSQQEIGLEKNIAKMLKLGAHIVNPLRSEPLTPRQEMIKKHVVDPIAKLSGGCALIGAAGAFTAVGAIKLTADALNQNFPETFGNKDSIEQIDKSQKHSAESKPESFASRVGRDYLSKFNEPEQAGSSQLR